MAREPRSANDGALGLVPNGLKEAALMMLFETYNERYTARRLAAYLEDLVDVELVSLQEAIRVWRRAQPPHRQAPSPADLRALAMLAQQASAPAPVADEAALRRGRATPQDIDEVFAQVRCTHPDSPFVRELLAYREQYRRQRQAEHAQEEP